MHFRLARLDDQGILNQISYRSKGYWGYPESWMEAWKKDLEVSESDLINENVLLVSISGKITGFCCLRDEITYYEIIHLWILPEYIGKGIGKALLDTAIKKFVVHQRPIRVEADPYAEEFYQRQGFVTFSKIESYPKGRYLPVMQKD